MTVMPDVYLESKGNLSKITPEMQALFAELSEMALPFMWTFRQEATRAFEPFGLRPIKVLLLELIGQGLQHPKALAEMLDAVPPAISALLAELEAQGFITRTLDPEDRRRVILELTGEGRVMREKLSEAWCRVMMRRFSRLDQSELESLLAIYRKLLRDA
jgi:DNA-binding MarR family transcriptional regulator